jgi:hypothetical protein
MPVALALAAMTSASGPWKLDQARESAAVSEKTCRAALAYLEQLGAVIQPEPGVWRRETRWRGTQADWYG